MRVAELFNILKNAVEEGKGNWIVEFQGNGQDSVDYEFNVNDVEFGEVPPDPDLLKIFECSGYMTLTGDEI